MSQPTIPEGEYELRWGYTLGDLNHLAHAAVRRDVYHQSMPFNERLEIAWSAIAEALYATAERPARADLIRVVWNALRAHVEDEWHTHGVSRTNVFESLSSVNFWRYWWEQTRVRSSMEECIVEQMALRQIWQQLHPKHQELLAALAEYDDYGLAAKALGIDRRQTFITYLSKARREFLAHWHEGEAPSKIWGADHRKSQGARHETVTYTLRRRRRTREKRAESKRELQVPETQENDNKQIGDL